jgi:5-methylcytosine-specific restriction endonuclease McrA
MKLSKEYLYKKYITHNETVTDIAKEMGISRNQVKNALRRNGIRKKALKLGNQTFDNKDWLYNEYMIKRKGYTVIANECKVSYTTILDRILYFGWPIRGHKDIDKGTPRRGKRHRFDSIEKIRTTRVKKRVVVKCNYCGKENEIVASKLKTYNHSYCDNSCFHSYLRDNRVESDQITDTAEYKEWRLKVYKRDGYRCKMPACNSNSRDIAAHHIFSKKLYPEKRFVLSNGITLCKSCHEKTYGIEYQFVDVLVRVIQTMDDK